MTDTPTTTQHQPVLVLPRNKYGRDRRHWLAARREGITASDAAAILGLDPWKTPLSVYADKVLPPASDDAGEAAYWGNALEHVVAVEWGKRNRSSGLRVTPTPGLLGHPQRPWQLATVDRYVNGYHPDRGTTDAVLECKTTGDRHDERWREDAPPPPRTVIQVLHQLIVTGCDVGYLACLVGGQKYRQWTIERDEDLCAHITSVELEFLQRIADRNPPAPTGHDEDDDALLALYPGAAGATVDIDPALATQRLELAAAKKWSTDALTLLDQEIKAAAGDATEIYAGGELAFTWRPSTSRRIDTTALKADEPDLAEHFTVESTTRRFLQKTVKEKSHAAA